MSPDRRVIKYQPGILTRAAQLFFCGLLFSVVIPVLRVAGAQTTVPAYILLDDYWQLVADSLDQVNQLIDIPPDRAREPLIRLAERWESISGVQLPNGDAIPLDASFLSGKMRADPPDLQSLANLLETLQSEKDQPPSASFTNADIHPLETILARPEFQWRAAEPSAWRRFLDRLWQGFWEIMVRLLGSRAGEAGSSIVNVAVILLGILILFLALLFAWRGIQGSLAAEVELDLDRSMDERLLTADSAFQQAQQLSEQGNNRLAVRYLYLSSLLLLEERGLLRYDRSRTNREYLRSLAGQPELVKNLQAVVETFDRVWYGYQSLETDDFQRYQAEVVKLRRLR